MLQNYDVNNDTNIGYNLQHILALISNEIGVLQKHVQNVVDMHLDGQTVPFITRYRKDATGKMNEIQIRSVIDLFTLNVELEKRKVEVIKNIEGKNQLTPQLKESILRAKTMFEVEELYAPYKTKSKTKAQKAIELGLEPVAEIIKSNKNDYDIEEQTLKFLTSYLQNEETKNLEHPFTNFETNQAEAVDIALTMGRDIIVAELAQNIDIRNIVNTEFQNGQMHVMQNSKKASSTTKKSSKKSFDDDSGTSEEDTTYENYYDYQADINKQKPHATLAIFRGEKEGALKVKFVVDEENIIRLLTNFVKNILSKSITFNRQIERCIKRAYSGYLALSAENNVRKNLRDVAELRALEVFTTNLKTLLTTPPVKNKRILGLDPGFKAGCKFAIIDEQGAVVDYGVVYPMPPQNDVEGSVKKLTALINKHGVNAIVIGNGTASRETELFVSDMLEANPEIKNTEYTIVNETGASVYSVNDVAIKEFPHLDATIRGAISIARRVLDPIGEYVKIEPRSIGIGMYQHDVNQKLLGTKLGEVIEDTVNLIGVDINTASAPLLAYVSGLNPNLADKIVAYREKIGRFSNRLEILNVDGLGDKTFSQCAGFLKIYGGAEALDSKFIHPENYEVVKKIMIKENIDANIVGVDVKNKYDRLLGASALNELSTEFHVGIETLRDIIESLLMPDLDVRDNLQPVVFKKGVINMKQVQAGDVLQGRVSNITDFGAFVDIGLKNDGLVHISEISTQFVKNVSDFVKTGETVTVRVLNVNEDNGRISLSMKNIEKQN